MASSGFIGRALTATRTRPLSLLSIGVLGVEEDALGVPGLLPVLVMLRLGVTDGLPVLISRRLIRELLLRLLILALGVLGRERPAGDSGRDIVAP
jgi:hypothetical protein